MQSHEAVGLPFEFWSGDEIQRRLQFDLQSYGPQVVGQWVGIGRWKFFFVGLNRPPNDVKVNFKIGRSFQKRVRFKKQKD